MPLATLLAPFALAAAAPLALPAGAPTQEAIGRALEKLRYSDVERRVAEIERVEPGSVEAVYWRGRLALEMCGDGAAALTAARACLRADPKRPAFLVLEGDGIGLAAAREGMWKAFRQLDDVLGRYEAALAIDPTCTIALQRLVQFHLVVPRVMGGGVDKAASFAQRLRAADPYLGALSLAAVARKRKNDAAAEIALREAAAAESGGARARAHLADLLRRTKRYDDAEIEARAAIAADPSSAYGWLSLAKTLRARGGPTTAAFEALSEGREQAGDHPLLAFEELELRLAAEGTDGLAVAADRMDSAVRHRSPDCWSAAPANRLLGDAYVRLGRRDDSMRCYRAYLAANPDDAVAKKGLTKLASDR